MAPDPRGVAGSILGCVSVRGESPRLHPLLPQSSSGFRPGSFVPPPRRWAVWSARSPAASGAQSAQSAGHLRAPGRGPSGSSSGACAAPAARASPVRGVRVCTATTRPRPRAPLQRCHRSAHGHLLPPEGSGSAVPGVPCGPPLTPQPVLELQRKRDPFHGALGGSATRNSAGARFSVPSINSQTSDELPIDKASSSAWGCHTPGAALARGTQRLRDWPPPCSSAAALSRALCCAPVRGAPCARRSGELLHPHPRAGECGSAAPVSAPGTAAPWASGSVEGEPPRSCRNPKAGLSPGAGRSVGRLALSHPFSALSPPRSGCHPSTNGRTGTPAGTSAAAGSSARARCAAGGERL